MSLLMILHMEEKIRHWLPGLDKRFSVCMERKKKEQITKAEAKNNLKVSMNVSFQFLISKL